jgi:hypothetical protein
MKLHALNHGNSCQHNQALRASGICSCSAASPGYDIRTLQKLKRTDIKDGFFDVVTQKTHDGLRIELNAMPRQYWTKFKMMTSRMVWRCPVISNVKMKRPFEILGQDAELMNPSGLFIFPRERNETNKLMPKWALLTTHCGRRTFVVTALQLGIRPR